MLPIKISSGTKSYPLPTMVSSRVSQLWREEHPCIMVATVRKFSWYALKWH